MNEIEETYVRARSHFQWAIDQIRTVIVPEFMASRVRAMEYYLTAHYPTRPIKVKGTINLVEEKDSFDHTMQFTLQEEGKSPFDPELHAIFEEIWQYLEELDIPRLPEEAAHEGVHSTYTLLPTRETFVLNGYSPGVSA